MVSDSELWFNKYYQGKTKSYVDSLLNQNNPNNTKSLAINQRQVYDKFPISIKWNQETERGGTANSGFVLDYLSGKIDASGNIKGSTFTAVSSQGIVTSKDPSIDLGLSVIPTASAEQEPVSLPSVYGAQYVPDVFLRRPGEVDTSTGEKVELSESIEYRRVKIINIDTGIIVFDGSLTVENIKLHQDDPRYRVEFVEPGSEPEPEPVTVAEPEEPMTTCIDVYRLSNGSVTTTRETVSYATMADYVNVQHLLVRECNQPVPTTQEVKTWYGYFEPEPEPEPKPTVVANPQLIAVGLLAGAVLAVPILDDLFKTKKKRR
jgi:hypothetical protein